MKIKEFFYKHSLFPPLLVLITNLSVSFLTRVITNNSELNNFNNGIDGAIPFLPGFIHIYFLAFAQWVICFAAVAILDDQKSWHFCMALSIANIICGIVFLAYPTVMSARPEFSGGDIFTELLGKTLFAIDNPPVNVFPSIHCLHSYAVMRMICSIEKVPYHLKTINALFTLLVFFSVIFVKQHFIIDIPAAIICFEFGALITKLTGIDKKLFKVKQKLYSSVF